MLILRVSLMDFEWMESYLKGYICVCVCVRILVILFTRGGSFLSFLSFLGEDSSIFNFFLVIALTCGNFVIDFVSERG